MEIGHNVLHGQWDWMRDPKIHSTTWDWDHASPPEQWKRAHNERHHTYTNILGKDNDLGYGILRVDEAQPCERRHLVQPLWNLFNACFFEYGIAMYDLDLGAELAAGGLLATAGLRTAFNTAQDPPAGDQGLRSAPAGGQRHGFGTADTACERDGNLLRNLWSHSVIMCGHFPEGVQTFEVATLDASETRGRWYVRQMLGSADISGSPLMHLLTGNLSHQIEHHLFPDLPSNRYREIATAVRDLFAKYGLRYHSAPLPRQVASAWHKVIRLSVPNGWWSRHIITICTASWRYSPASSSVRAMRTASRRNPFRDLGAPALHHPAHAVGRLSIRRP